MLPSVLNKKKSWQTLASSYCRSIKGNLNINQTKANTGKRGEGNQLWFYCLAQLYVSVCAWRFVYNFIFLFSCLRNHDELELAIF